MTLEGKRRLPYEEGDLFGVPLRDGGYGAGLVARTDGRGGLIGFFVALWFPTVPLADEVASQPRSMFEFVMRLGDLGLITGKWPLIGRMPTFRRDDWKVPPFGHREEFTGRLLRIEYSDDTLDEVSRMRTTASEFDRLPQAGLSGAGFVETRLSRLLSERPPAG